MIIGILWLFFLRWKLPPNFASTEHRSLLEWLQLEVEYAAFPFYGNLVETLLLPNFTLFAWLIFLLELTVGFSLLTGTLTRGGSIVGLLMSLNLGIGLLDVPGEWPWSYAMMAMWHGLFFVAAAGRVWGGDRWLHGRYRHLLWVRWLA